MRRLGTDLPRTRSLVLTMHEEEEYVRQVVLAGACGYLVKHAPITELMKAIRVIASGGVYFGPHATRILAEQLQPSKVQDPYGALSSRKRKVLHLVADGLTIKEIARKLEVSTKTAENHRSRVLAKLGVRNSAELVRYAMRKGLVE